jgi:hypothetical protein
LLEPAPNLVALCRRHQAKTSFQLGGSLGPISDRAPIAGPNDRLARWPNAAGATTGSKEKDVRIETQAEGLEPTVAK